MRDEFFEMGRYLVIGAALAAKGIMAYWGAWQDEAKANSKALPDTPSTAL